MNTLVSSPECYDPTDPSVVGYWLATESPNVFRMLRQDQYITNLSSNGAVPPKLVLNLPGIFIGADGDNISVVADYGPDALGNRIMVVYVGTVVSGDGTATLVTDIDWLPVMATATAISHLNDNTLYGGFYYEARLVINGIVQPITVNASPDTFGFADIDISGVLRISTWLAKEGDYSTWIMKESPKSGNFTFEWRVRYFGLSDLETLNPYIPIGSPAVVWYYAECVRSEEQGSNLHHYVATSVNDAPFLNSFDQPVYFHGLPWDISFILPELFTVSPAADISVTIRFYRANNTLSYTSGPHAIDVDSLSLDGHVASLTIDPSEVPSDATYFTAEITAP